MGPMISWVVALHTVLDTAEPVTLCWAAVIRSVRLWPDISAAPPPALPLGSRRGTGTPKRRRAPAAPRPRRTPLTPHRPPSSSACRPGAGLRAARRHPDRKEPAQSDAGSGAASATPPAPPQFRLSPPLVSWSPAGREAQAAAGKWP